MVTSLTDLGEGPDEAEAQYLYFAEGGVNIQVFDASYMNTAILAIGTEANLYQKMLIHNLIQDYYQTESTQMSESELDILSSMKGAKKYDA